MRFGLFTVVGTPRVETMRILFILSYGEAGGASEDEQTMKRGQPLILPYCPFCGKYKGVGLCPDVSCPGSLKEKLVAAPPVLVSPGKDETTCVICGGAASSWCVRCLRAYCHDHASNSSETEIISADQHLGTCSICHQTVCEKCWMVDRDGKIVCMQHVIDRSDHL